MAKKNKQTLDNRYLYANGTDLSEGKPILYISGIMYYEIFLDDRLDPFLEILYDKYNIVCLDYDDRRIHD